MFDPVTFAALAKRLPTHMDGKEEMKEARARAAWGRAYYALFLAVRKEVRAARGQPLGGRDPRVKHGQLTDLLFSTENDELHALAKKLEDLYQLRVQADYVLALELPRWKDVRNGHRAKKEAQRVEGWIKTLIPTVDFSDLSR